MANEDSAWLSELSVQSVFMRFPVALAIIGHDGKVERTNERFSRIFDSGILHSDTLRSIARTPGQPWQVVRLFCSDGRNIDASVQAISIQNSIMLVIDETPGPLSADEIERLRTRIAELERLGSTDHLTGAWNRAHLDRVIESELSRSARFRLPVSLILMDIDHFKRINDEFGHATGDTVLRELVQVVTTTLRSADVLFRWGGEEFVVLTFSSGYRKGGVLAERLRQQVEQHAFAVVGSLTISLGVAEHLAAESAEVWFRRVDAALYAGKNSGRNRVIVDGQGNSDSWAQEQGQSALRLVWLEAYESGEPTIDREHRELFELANALIQASLAKEESPQQLNSMVDRLLVHIEKHFADEEALLEKSGYARLASHKQAHASLLRRAAGLQASVKAGELTWIALIEFLARDVVARHLFTADRDFFPLFQAHLSTNLAFH